MARVIERPRQSVKLHHNQPESTREFGIFGATTRDEAVAAIEAYAPLVDTVANVARFRDVIDIMEFDGGGGCWEAKVTYRRAPETTDPSLIEGANAGLDDLGGVLGGDNSGFNDDLGANGIDPGGLLGSDEALRRSLQTATFEFNVQIGSSTRRITNSIETVETYPCQSLADAGIGALPDFKKGIGYDGEKFDGVDIRIPSLDITITKRFQASVLSAVSASYITTLYSMQQTVNDRALGLIWRGQRITFPKGSLRLDGVDINQRSDNQITITYKLCFSRGISADDGVTIGDSQAIVVEGHQYWWVYWKETVSNGHKIRTPVAIYVEKVYNYSDFRRLLL